MTPVNPRQTELGALRGSRLMPILSALFLLLLWSVVVETLHERAAFTRKQIQTEQQRWLQQAVRGIDTRLETLRRDMLLYRQDGSSLAREANSLYPLEHGRLWLVDADSQSQLHGDLDNLAPVTADSVRQLLQQHPVDGRLLLLDADTRRDTSRLLVVIPQCEADNCRNALVGFVSFTALLDSELLAMAPQVLLSDSSQNALVSLGAAADRLEGYLNQGVLRSAPASTELTSVPLTLSVQLSPVQYAEPFVLFALYLTAAATLMSGVLLVILLRVGRRLSFILQRSDEVNQATHLLTLTNNSLRERLRKLIEEQRDQQTLIDTVQVGVLLIDAEQKIILTGNEAATRLLGFARQALYRRSLESLFTSAEQYAQLLSLLQEQQQLSEREVELSTRSGERLWSVLSMRPLLFRERNAYVLSFVDITERLLHAQRLEEEKQATERALSQLQSTQHELYQRATCDDLTGIANRRHFLSGAGKALELARLENQCFVVAVLDVDHFKSINDRYGHAAGDSVLQRLTQHIAATLPHSALFGRMGGEEFAIVLPDYNLNEAHALLESVRLSLAALPLLQDGDMVHITFSAGLAERKRHGEQLSELLKIADHAMYQAKSEGRNRIHSAAPAQNG
ncbi:diguanylate cyclase (GGDEF)-like protein/PAS domain S-box-containing protein [Vogesella perlucida]|nr:diguanylate cyclase (GGDEF)-like protein/PAS domain S-box-containing protein [Vogesella perlucida]